MSTQDNTNKDSKKSKEEEQNKKEQSGQGDGYVPPTPDVPSAQNAREHSGPITSRTPKGRKH